MRYLLLEHTGGKEENRKAEQGQRDPEPKSLASQELSGLLLHQDLCVEKMQLGECGLRPQIAVSKLAHRSTLGIDT
jgi:hypothetical protein